MKSKNGNQLFSFGGALILFLSIAVVGGFGAQALAQQKPGSKPANSGKKSAVAQNSQRSADQGAKESRFAERDSPEQVREREKWFYKQRAFPIGRIPAGARFKGFGHMQRMMEMEGKLFRLPDGTFAAATVPQAAVSSSWASIGPAPTSSAFFGPVSGRVKTIAVDPTDPTGDTVLIGGAQGGIWRTTNGGQTWTALGDFSPSLAMGSIVFAPSNSAIAYAGTGEQASTGSDVYYGAGILKSIDGGLTWNPTCPVPGPTCNNPFLGPFGDFFFPGGGARISYIAVNPSNENLVLAGTQIFTGTNSAGVYCSNDGGLNWTNILPGQMATFVGFASNTVAFAALGRPFGSASGGGQTNANGIYKSSDANGNCSAITFQNLTTLAGSGLPTTNVGRIDMGIDSSGITVYASISDSSTASSTNLGVWKTTNGGTTWTLTAAPDFCRAQCWYDNVVKVNPTNSNMAFVGGSAVISGNFAAWVQRTTNAGTNWSPILPDLSQPGGIGPGLPHVDVHAFAFVRVGTQLRMYMGNDGGMWRTDDAEAATVTWTNINGNLALSQFYPSLSIHPSNPTITFAGTQDNGSQNYTGSVNWTDNEACGDGGWTTIDPAVPSTVYLTCQFIDIHKSAANGVPGSFGIFNWAGTGINQNDNVNFIPPLVIDSMNPQRLYFGTSRLWQTTNGGRTWQAISNDLSTNFGVITTMAVGGSGSVVYAGTDDGLVFVATNVAPGSGTFNNRTAGLPGRSVTQVMVDPLDPTGNTAYVALSGFSGFIDQQGHIFKTVNAGTTWIDVSCTVGSCGNPAATDLPNIPVNDLVVDPDVPGTLYAATDLGAFMTSDAGVTWSTLGTGLPNVAVFSLRLHGPSRTLRAATHGRGAWDIVLDNFVFSGPHISSITPTSRTEGDPSFTMTVNGSGLTGGTVQWNGTGVPTTPVSDTQLTATIDASLFASDGTAQVTVTAGAATSNALKFTVVNRSTPPPNDNFVNATNVSGNSFTDAVDNFAATTEPNDPTPSASCVSGSSNPRAKTVWYRLLASGTGTVTADTFGSSYDTILTVVTGSQGSFTQVACNDDIQLGFQRQSRVTFSATQGTTYFFMISPFDPTFPDSAGGETVFNFSFAPAPDFTLTAQAPTSVTVNAGQPASFTIAVGAQNGFAGTVNFTCSSPAGRTTCTANPASVTPPGNTTVTVTTTARGSAPPAAPWRVRPWPIFVPLLVLVAVLLILLAKVRARRVRLALSLPLAALVVLLIFQAAGCGGGGGGGGSTGTPAGTYTITVTGTSGGTSHNTTVTLVVN